LRESSVKQVISPYVISEKIFLMSPVRAFHNFILFPAGV